MIKTNVDAVVDLKHEMRKDSKRGLVGHKTNKLFDVVCILVSPRLSVTFSSRPFLECANIPFENLAVCL